MSAIHTASGNHWLVEQLNQIQIHINAYQSMPYQVRGRLAESVQEHAEILEAILSGDGSRAADLMRDHMMMQGKRLPSILKSVEQFQPQ